MTVSEALSSFADVVERASKRGESTLIVDRGQPLARIVPVESSVKTTDEFLKAWPTMRHLTPEEATDFEADILEAKKRVPPPGSKWD